MKDYEFNSEEEQNIIINTLLNLAGENMLDENMTGENPAFITINATKMAKRPFWKAITTNRRFRSLENTVENEGVRLDSKHLKIDGEYKPINPFSRMFNRVKALGAGKEEKDNAKFSREAEKQQKSKRQKFKEKLSYKQTELQQTLRTMPKEEQIEYLQDLINSKNENLMLNWNLRSDVSVDLLKNEAKETLSYLKAQQAKTQQETSKEQR